ncbi:MULTISPECIES: hypothetical protein [Streptomyces]|uniref:Uncharacterized protein n=1 Tax=Streptomyces antibioticus TaxID=1890 RepID=A0AAE7CL73_STRAT|nr:MULTISPECIES: hypothetical protein [Streptomyces]MBO7935125.1 hypothetical protein [Streptomyces sp. S9]NUV58694.1 hypothetical protein [Streptomyces sp. CAI-85]OOQ51145.1 hypothetical protein AFM16_18285 [Streptomyces antibioticus]QIT45305.1 hypothetical protein HCX60_18565 [Streptomyces antibioticus]
MLLLSALQGLLEITVGVLAQARLGTVGLILLFGVGVGLRARHNGLAVGAAVVLMFLMTQA